MTSDADAATSGDGPPAGTGHVAAGLLGAPVALVADVAGEVAAAVPRLLGRTRRQVDLTRRLVSHLPCAGFLAPPPPVESVPAHEVAPVDVLSVIREADDEAVGTVGDAGEGAATATGTEGAIATGDVEAPVADDLAVPDYDALSASQVVPRLASLSPEELEAVRAYERAHRNRQTILGRVSQLLEG